MHDTIRWLLLRENAYTEETEEDSQTDQPEVEDVQEEFFVPGLTTELADFVGFNGRCNKRVDTCYAFWVGASLDVCISNPPLMVCSMLTVVPRC